MAQRSALALLLAVAVTLSWPGAQSVRVQSAKRRNEAANQVPPAFVEAVGESTVSGRRRRRRRSCNDFFGQNGIMHRSNSVKCTTAQVGACKVPEAYMLALFDGGRGGLLASFDDERDARSWNGNDGSIFWVRFNEKQEVVADGNNCGNHGDFYDYALKLFYQITECKYPAGSWRRVVSLKNDDPGVSLKRCVKVFVGSSYTETNSETVKYGVSSTVSFQGFKSSSKFEYIATTTQRATWETAEEEEQCWTLGPGATATIWQYTMHAKCFNNVGMFLDEGTYETSIFHVTEKNQPPTCDPNKPDDCD